MYTGTEDLGTGLLWLGAFVAVASGVVLVVAWWGRRRGSRTIALDAADTLSRMWLLGIALGIFFAVSQAFQPWVDLSDVPVALEWPGRPDGSVTPDTAGPALVAATARAVSLSAVNVTVGTRAVIAAGALLTLLLWALPAIIVQVLTRQSLRGKPFTPRVVRALSWGAAGLLTLGMTADLLQQIGKGLVAREVLAPPYSDELLTALPYFPLSLPLWPAAAALALTALATVFRYGTALQHQTEALQRETEGLV